MLGAKPVGGIPLTLGDPVLEFGLKLLVRQLRRKTLGLDWTSQLASTTAGGPLCRHCNNGKLEQSFRVDRPV